LGAFADLWYLMQPPYSQEYVNLHQIPNLGKIARKLIIPCYEYVNRASYFYRIGSKINRAIPKLRLLTTPLGNLVSHIFKVGAMAAGGAVLLALRHPLVVQTQQVAIKVLAKGGEIYQKIVISSSVSYYLGGPVGAISNLTGLPKDRLAIPVGMTALATWYLTGNHLVTTLVTVATDTAVRSPLLQEMANEAKEVVTSASPSIPVPPQRPQSKSIQILSNRRKKRG
jgi:hypothetical protein